MSDWRVRRVLGVLLALWLAGSTQARASLTVLVEEPFGAFGTMMPFGHVAVYLDRVCADGPLHVRMCQAGEAQGTAVARLDAIGKVDWVASPILPFLYATDDPAQVLRETTKENVAALREQYRAAHLQELLPDGSEQRKENSDWWELAGAAYSRRLWGYQVATTRAQDEALVAWLNARENRHVYGLRTRNCADFAAEVVNFYFPGTVHRSHLADLGFMSPKQVAKGVWTYGRAHPEADLKVVAIPQVPGKLRRSRPARGAAEGLLKTQRYLATLLVIQPEAVAALAVMYLDGGRWQLGQGAAVEQVGNFAGEADTLASR